MRVAEDERADYHGTLLLLVYVLLHKLHLAFFSLTDGFVACESKICGKRQEGAIGKGENMDIDGTVEFNGPTHSTKPPRHIKRPLIFNHFLQKAVHRLELNERRNVKPAIVLLTRVDFADAGRRSAFQRALKEMIFPMLW